jgi:hypothetical protein
MPIRVPPPYLDADKVPIHDRTYIAPRDRPPAASTPAHQPSRPQQIVARRWM